MQGTQQSPAPIDVLIPVWNGAATVASAIASIQQQTLANLRIIVIDDGSTDATSRILAQMAASDARILVLTIPHGGIVDALNAGLAHCTSEFVARHDADDIAFPHRFAEQVAYLDANPDCVAVASYARVIDEHGRPTGGFATSIPESFDPTWIPCKEPYLLHPFMMVRRHALMLIGGYRYVYHAEDADLCWRLQELGKLHAIPRPLGDYRIHGGSVTGLSTLNGRLSALYSQLAAISALRRRNNAPDLPDLAFPKSAIDLMTAAATPAAMFEIGRRDLTSTESAYLKAAFAAKYLELASYRSYEIELDDCRFVHAVLRPVEPTLPAANQRSLRRSRSVMASRLLSKGRLRAAFVLLTPSTLVETATRFAVHVISRCLPAKVRVAIWDWRSRRIASELP